MLASEGKLDFANPGVVGEVGDEPSAENQTANCHGPCTGQVWNGARVGVEVGKFGKARIQVSVQGTSPSGDGKEARGAFPEFRAGATMLAGARNCHFQALKVPLGPSGLLPANKRWSVLRKATMYLAFNLQISRFSTKNKCHLQYLHNTEGGHHADDNDEDRTCCFSVVSFSVEEGKKRRKHAILSHWTAPRSVLTVRNSTCRLSYLPKSLMCVYVPQ